MWSYRLGGPMRYVSADSTPPPADNLPAGTVLLEFLAGGICGSDIARCLDGGCAASPGPVGLSLHEIVGRVVASNSELTVGERVAGWVGQSLGLQRFVVTEAEALAPIDSSMDDIEAVPLQPLACVLHALTRLPDDLTDAHVAIIGLGPIGLLFAHALHDRRAASITGIDLVDRSGVAETFGLDVTEAVTSRTWAQRDDNRHRYDIVIEAVGHQVGTLQDAIAVVAAGGTIVYFGNPDDRYYPVDFGQMMDKDVTLQTGRTPQGRRGRAIVRAQEYARRYPGLFARYVTHVVPITEVQRAYELAARPAPDRLKVVLDARPSSVAGQASGGGRGRR
jgi:L-iditol 2-dehydrogenase